MKEIRKDVPAPAHETWRQLRKYPFKDMAIGDSICLSNREEAQKVKRAAWRWRQRHMPWMFTVQRDGGGELRLWRIDDRPKRIPSKALKRAAERYIMKNA